MLLGYLLLTSVAIGILEPGITPPGYTGKGALAMLVILAGAFHAAGRLRQAWVYLVFGGIGAIVLLPAYLGDGRLALRFQSGYAKPDIVVGRWMVFVVATALLARMMAKVRWRLIEEVPVEGWICAGCGYDLRASTERCPECGVGFDRATAARWIVTRWHWGWLAKRVLLWSVVIGVPWFCVDEWLYWRSEQPTVALIEAKGGTVNSELEMPRGLYGMPEPVLASYRHAEVADLRGGIIGDGDLEVLEKLGKLEELHIEGSGVTGTGLRFLAGTTTFERLYMEGSAANDGGMPAVGRLTHLKQLQLSGTHVTDVGLRELAGLKGLTALWLENMAITDSGLDAVKQMESLECLFLTDTPVTDKGIEQVVGLKRLYTISVGGTAVTDAGLLKLAGIPGLRYVIVKGSPVTAQGAAEMRRLRPEVNVEGI